MSYYKKYIVLRSQKGAGYGGYISLRNQDGKVDITANTQGAYAGAPMLAVVSPDTVQVCPMSSSNGQASYSGPIEAVQGRVMFGIMDVTGALVLIGETEGAFADPFSLQRLILSSKAYLNITGTVEKPVQAGTQASVRPSAPEAAAPIVTPAPEEAAPANITAPVEPAATENEPACDIPADDASNEEAPMPEQAAPQSSGPSFTPKKTSRKTYRSSPKNAESEPAEKPAFSSAESYIAGTGGKTQTKRRQNSRAKSGQSAAAPSTESAESAETDKQDSVRPLLDFFGEPSADIVDATEQGWESTPPQCREYSGMWEWKKILRGGEPHFMYLTGRVEQEGRIVAVAVAVPGEFSPSPPPNLKGFCGYLDGYWILAQDAATGKKLQVV